MNKLDRLKDLEAKATPGPWKYGDMYEDNRENDIVEPDGYAVIHRDSGCYTPDSPTADLIIAMRNALPKLLPYIEKLEAVINQTKQWAETPLAAEWELLKYRIREADKARAELEGK